LYRELFTLSGVVHIGSIDVFIIKEFITEFIIGNTDRIEDVMTDPDDYFLVPPSQDINHFVEDGDYWEVVDNHNKY
jgi:hypothetical protein